MTGRFPRMCMAALLLGPVLTARAQLITPGAQLVPVFSGGGFYEGPTWDPFTARLYFSSLTSNQLFRLTPPATVTPWMNSSQGINGTFLSLDGRLLCAQGNLNRIVSFRIGDAGPEDLQVLAAGNGEWQLPNDLCQTASGDIYFSASPTSGAAARFVYHRAPGGTVTPVVTDMNTPNGVITSNDGQTLYVADSATKLWRSYPILPGGGLGAGSTFFNPATANTADPDGMSIDEFGNLYFCGRGGLWLVSPAGTQLDMMPVPEFNTNVTFGGVNGRTLYITTNGKVYSLSMEVRGANWRNVPANNQPPQVNAGPDQIISLRSGVALMAATATDDGLPDPPGALTLVWSRLSGPAPVLFSDPGVEDPGVTFSVAGTYVLRLFAYDGIVSSTDDVQINVSKPADMDGDGDVDNTDVLLLSGCLTGPGIPPTGSSCVLADVDVDDDVDMTDFGYAQRCLSGPVTPSDPNCAD